MKSSAEMSSAMRMFLSVPLGTCFLPSITAVEKMRSRLGAVR